MNRVATLLLCLVASLPPLAVARGAGGVAELPRRNESGSLNWAPLPSTYTVVSVDSYGGTVTVRDRGGAVMTVRVEEHVYDLDRLAPGDAIAIDFFRRDGRRDGPAAAAIWPASK